jgi:glycosyltransferase involved in cell wall biosynthesis
MMAIKVSVIIPVFNGEITIEDALKSIFSQSYQNFEIIVCDDASTDDTQFRLSSFQDKRLIIIRNEKNLGPGLSRDRAMTLATGEWITFIDADDLWDRERIEKLLSVVQHNPLLVAFDNLKLISDNNKYLGNLREDSAFNNLGQAKFIQIIDLIKSPRMLIQPFFSKSLLDISEAKHSHDSYGEDTFFLLRLLEKSGGLVYYPEPLYFYRVGHVSASSNPRKYILLAEILEKSISVFGDNKPVQDALMIKLKNINKGHIRYQFSSSLKSLNFALALNSLIKEPLVIWYFFKHNFNLSFLRIRRFFQKGDK